METATGWLEAFPRIGSPPPKRRPDHNLHSSAQLLTAPARWGWQPWPAIRANLPLPCLQVADALQHPDHPDGERSVQATAVLQHGLWDGEINASLQGMVSGPRWHIEEKWANENMNEESIQKWNPCNFGQLIFVFPSEISMQLFLIDGRPYPVEANSSSLLHIHWHKVFFFCKCEANSGINQYEK